VAILWAPGLDEAGRLRFSDRIIAGADVVRLARGLFEACACPIAP
jgi:hypothetical protein